MVGPVPANRRNRKGKHESDRPHNQGFPAPKRRNKQIRVCIKETMEHVHFIFLLKVEQEGQEEGELSRLKGTRRE